MSFTWFYAVMLALELIALNIAVLRLHIYDADADERERAEESKLKNHRLMR